MLKKQQNMQGKAHTRNKDLTPNQYQDQFRVTINGTTHI